MLRSSTVLPEEGGDDLLHFSNVLLSAGVERVLNDGRLGATRSAEGTLQSLIAAHAGITFIQPAGAGEDGDEGVVELFGRGKLHLLLRHMHGIPDRFKELELLQLEPNSC